ncbi:hypothetical protein [Turicimonas muris]|uniref:hypothetical protein n=1 Tax=Turicimonas muris TaxID=1796652 RepID=UPI0023F4FC46|nr:hypothetical protein [Turicimonas muris]
MSLKAYLQALLNLFVKKSETEFIGAQALPGNRSGIITYYYQYKGDMIVTEIAPANGWLNIVCGNLIKYVYLENTNSYLTTRLENRSDSLQWPQLFVPLKKGDSWRIELSVREGQTEGTTIRFIPSNGS